MPTPKKALLADIALDTALAKLGVSYTRYSTDEQGSTQEQQEINEGLASDDDIAIVMSFPDEGISRSLSERPELLNLFAYLEANRNVRYLIVNELERLTAGVGQRQQITSLCKRLGITIITEDMGAIDPHDDEKMHEADQRSVASQGELLKIRRRTRRNLRTRVSKQRTVAFRPPYGVRMVPLVLPDGTKLPSGASMIDSSGKRVNSGKIELHPDEHPHLVQMFEWSAAGIGVTEITRRLNEQKVPTKTGLSRWQPSTVVNILGNPFYKGELTWGLQETRRDEHGVKYMVLRPKGDPGRVDLESPLGAIIDSGLWERALKKREAKAAAYRIPERQRQPRKVLDGRVYCMRCERKMYGRNHASGQRRADGVVLWSYDCNSVRLKQVADAPINCTKIHSMSLADILDALANFTDRAGKNISVVRGISGEAIKLQRKGLEDKIQKALNGIDRVEDLAAEGDISREKLREKKAAFAATIATARQDLAALGEPREAVVKPIFATQMEGFGELIELLTDDKIPLEMRVAALDEFGLERIYVDDPLLRLQLRD